MARESYLGYTLASERDKSFQKIRDLWTTYEYAYRNLYRNRLFNNTIENIGRVNFLKEVPEIMTWFIFGLKGVSIKLMSEGKEIKKIQKEFDRVLKANNFQKFCLEAITNMIKYGDAFSQVGWEEPEDSNEFFRRKNGFGDNGICRFKILDNFIVYPVLKMNDTTKVDYYVISTEQADIQEPDIEFYRSDVVQYYKGSNKTRPILTIPNPVIGDLPITHLKNMGNAMNFYGIAEYEDLFPINSEYIVKNKLFGIGVDMTSNPPTIAKGTRFKGKFKYGGDNFVNLGKTNATIEYLELKGNLEAVQNYLKRAEDDFNTIAGIPEIARGRETSISNTSSAAMKILYYPLILKTGLKRPAIDEFITDMAYKMLIFMEMKGTIKKIPEDLEFMLSYPNPFPKDINSIIQEIQSRRDSNSITKKQILELYEVGTEDMNEVLKTLGEEIAPQETIIKPTATSKTEFSKELKSDNTMEQQQNPKQ